MKETLKRFIAAAEALAADPSDTLAQTVRRNTSTAAVIKKTCFEGLGIIQTSIEMGLSGQQVRNILDAFATDLLATVRSGASTGRYTPFEVSTNVSGTLRRLDAEGCCGMSVAELKSLLGDATDGMAELAMRCFDCGSYGPVDCVVDESYVTPKGCGRALTPVMRRVNSLLKDAVHPVRESELILKLRKEDRRMVDTALAILRHCPQYEHVTRDGISFFSLVWKELGSVQKQVERILWENRGRGLEKAAIEEEYLSRLRACGVHDAPKDIILKDSANIGGANGLWRWKEDGVGVVKDCRPLIQDYVVRKNAPVTLGEIVSFVDSLGVKLSRNSVETYLLLCCTHRRKTDDYVLKSVKAPSGRGDMTMTVAQALRKAGRAMTVKEIQEATGLLVARVYRILGSHGEIFEKIPGARKKGGDGYRLKKSWDGSYTPETSGVRRTPAYYELVRRATVQMLRNVPSGELPMNAVKESLGDVIPDIISAKHSIVSKLMRRYDDFIVSNLSGGRKSVRLNPSVYPSHNLKAQFSLARDWNSLRSSMASLAVSKGWMLRSDALEAADTMLDIMGMGRQVNSNSYFHLMAEMLHGWFGGSLRSRDLEYTRNLLSLNYEKFLRNFYEMKNGCMLITSPGLGGVVKDLQTEGLLPLRRYGDWRTDALSHIISVRGAVAHPDRRDQMDRIVENIHEFIRLFLYTSSLMTKESARKTV